jgi:hypothetical protein
MPRDQKSTSESASGDIAAASRMAAPERFVSQPERQIGPYEIHDFRGHTYWKRAA